MKLYEGVIEASNEFGICRTTATFNDGAVCAHHLPYTWSAPIAQRSLAHKSSKVLTCVFVLEVS